MSDRLSLQLTRETPCARLTLASPAGTDPVLTRGMWRSLPGLLAQVEASPAILALVIESATPGCFCAGADPAEEAHAATDPGFAGAMADDIQAGLRALANMSKPSIALLRGVCAGSGVALALGCDLRFADDTLRMGMTQGRMGLLPSFAEARALAQRVGLSRAADLMFSGRLLSASEAERIGLIDDCWARDAFAEAVAEFLAAVCAQSQYSVRGAKALLRAVAGGAATDSGELRAVYVQAFSGADHREANAAAQEGRPPEFRWR